MAGVEGRVMAGVEARMVAASRRTWWRIWIGTTHLDRLLSYPDVRNLSGCSQPIRVRDSQRLRCGCLRQPGSSYACWKHRSLDFDAGDVELVPLHG